MKKNRGRGYAILGILFVLVSVLVFVVPTAKTAPFWIAYGFTVIAFAAQLLIWKTALGREETLKSKFLGFPVVHIGIGYLVLQLAALAVFLFFPTLPAWSAVVVCAVIAGGAAVCMIAADAGRGQIERVEAAVQKKVSYLKDLQAEVGLLADAEADGATKAALRQLAEKIRFSDPMSSDRLAELEHQISAKAVELKTSADKAAVISELNLLLDQRNQTCKNLKSSGRVDE